MRKIGIYIIILTCFLFYHLETFSQVSVQNVGDIQEKKNLILNQLIGEGVTIVGDITCNCDSLGSVSNAEDVFEMNDGILLTTSYPAQLVAGSTGLAANGNSDSDIRIIVGNSSVNDACIIEFDAKFASNGLAIEYVFASQEYTGFTCSQFNDAFGFFVSGPGINGQMGYLNDAENIALIEGTQIPVSINTVNSGECSPNYGCDISNPYRCNLTMGRFFKQNKDNQYPEVKIQGFTTLLKAIKSLQKETVYHIKIVVADVTDHNYDSGVLLKMGGIYSMEVPQITMDCGNGATLTTKQYDGYRWKLNNGYIDGATSQTIHPQEYGDYSVEVLMDTTWVPSEAFTYNSLNACPSPDPCTPHTLLFKEDFGGNSIFSPVVSPQGFSSTGTVSGLTYNPWTSFLLPVGSASYADFLLYHYNLLHPFALRTDNYSFVKKGKSRSGIWYEPYDHTHPNASWLGYMMEVNGSSRPATYYSVSLTENLCPGSQLNFSAWGMSLMKSKNYRNAELKLVIRRPGSTTPVAWKNITLENGNGNWEPFELNYVLREGDESGLVFEIINNSSSGEDFQGNDFALDDIEVRVCTPKVELKAFGWICKGNDLKIEYINNGDFSDPTYQWFKSSRGSINGEWDEISGANDPILLIENAELTDAGYYRLVITDGTGSCPAKSDPIRIFVRDCDICADCVSSFAPVPGEKYVLSAWVKETGHSVVIEGEDLTGEDLMITSYENSVIALSFENSDEVIGAMAEGAIIDGWQRIYTEFTVPAEAVKMHLDLGNTGIGESYFDDIRVFPFNGNMKSYVYDPVTMRLVAELDNENYATFYEYDEEGALIRVKKETEKGVMTIREARQAKQKTPQP